MKTVLRFCIAWLACVSLTGCYCCYYPRHYDPTTGLVYSNGFAHHGWIWKPHHVNHGNQQQASTQGPYWGQQTLAPSQAWSGQPIAPYGDPCSACFSANQAGVAPHVSGFTNQYVGPGMTTHSSANCPNCGPTFPQDGGWIEGEIIEQSPIETPMEQGATMIVPSRSAPQTTNPTNEPVPAPPADASYRSSVPPEGLDEPAPVPNDASRRSRQIQRLQWIPTRR